MSTFDRGTPTHLDQSVILEYVVKRVNMRLAGKVEPRPYVPVGADHAL